MLRELFLWPTIFQAGYLTQEISGYATSAVMKMDIFKPAMAATIQVPSFHDRGLNAC